MRCLVPLCLVALAACSGHRYGFFGDEDGETGGGTSTTSPDPTLTPTTDPPITTTPDPTNPNPTTSDPTIPDPTVPDPTTTGPSTLTDSSDPSTVSDPSTFETTDTTSGPELCNEVLLEPLVPQSVFASNFGNPDLFKLSCNPTVAGEAVFVWQAPFGGVFRFDTIGSSFDTVLGVLGDFCGGPEFGCNDDFEGPTSALEFELAGGQLLTLVVEGLGGAEGELALNITQVDLPPPSPCNPIDLGTVSGGGGFFGSTIELDDLRFGTCGGDGAPEQGFMWTAPHSGVFRFHVAGNDFDPVLYVRDDDCDGPELACNDDFDGLNAQVDLVLGPEDGPIFLFVDGIGSQAGTYDLSISEF